MRPACKAAAYELSEAYTAVGDEATAGSGRSTISMIKTNAGSAAAASNLPAVVVAVPTTLILEKSVICKNDAIFDKKEDFVESLKNSLTGMETLTWILTVSRTLTLTSHPAAALITYFTFLVV